MTLPFPSRLDTSAQAARASLVAHCAASDMWALEGRTLENPMKGPAPRHQRRSISMVFAPETCSFAICTGPAYADAGGSSASCACWARPNHAAIPRAASPAARVATRSGGGSGPSGAMAAAEAASTIATAAKAAAAPATRGAAINVPHPSRRSSRRGEQHLPRPCARHAPVSAAAIAAMPKGVYKNTARADQAGPIGGGGAAGEAAACAGKVMDGRRGRQGDRRRGRRSRRR